MTSYERLKTRGSAINMTKKFTRLMQLNSRFCILASLILTIFIFLILLNQIPTNGRTGKLHKYILNIFEKSCPSIKSAQHKISINSDDDYEILWGNETIELFKDQLGVTFSDDNEDDNMKCRSGEFLISALPGPDEENFPEVLWQFFSLDALEQLTQQCDKEKRLFLKAVYTERMISHLNQIFDGLSLETITNFPSSCYNLKYAKIIGNISPIELNKIATSTPFLLDPKAKRWKEISMRFQSKRPFLRMNENIVRKVHQKLEIAKTVSRIRGSHDDNNFNFIGVYIRSNDKLPPEYYTKAMNFHQKNSTKRNIFVVICDQPKLIFCREVFLKNTTAVDVHLTGKSIDTFDFILMSTCNSTIISNGMGVLHAIINGGITVAFKPGLKDDPQSYVPWLISEKIDNWHSIGSNA
ncbi:hypothetical protein ACKWTF_008201 [Chironomus riparius]